MEKIVLRRDLGMLLKGLIPIKLESLGPSEIEAYWKKYFPNHSTERPTSRKFTDFKYNAFRLHYIGLGREKSFTFFERTPHAFILGQELCGYTKIIKSIEN